MGRGLSDRPRGHGIPEALEKLPPHRIPRRHSMSPSSTQLRKRVQGALAQHTGLLLWSGTQPKADLLTS